MAPLAITGITSLIGTAVNAVDRFAQRKAAEHAQPTVEFARLLQSASAPDAKTIKAEEIKAASRELLDAPEVQAALSGKDLSKGVTLRVEGGQVSIVAPDGSTQSVRLSSESQALAQKLNGLDLAVGA